MSFFKLFDYTQPIVAGATILGVSLVVLGGIGGYTAYRVKVAGDTVSVTGSAREGVTSDYARLTLSIQTKTGIADQESGFMRLNKAAQKITAYLKEEGLSDVDLPAAFSNPEYYYPEKAAPVMTGYSISRQIVVRSDDLKKMQELANSIAPFSGEGYTVSVYGLELTYRKLDEMRVALLSKAIADAKARAEAIAKESGRTVGQLRTSASGVVQVLPKGGVDVSDYGTYDTQSLEKEVMVTVRATFSLK